MDKLQVINHNSIDAVDSREVAQMMEKPHNDLMKSIRNYCDALTAGDFSLSDFFIPSNYVDSTGRRLPCYLITRKGCDFIASRMSGKRGVQFSARYVCAFDDIGRKKYVLARSLYAATGKTGVHTRHVGLDRDTNKELLLKHIRQNNEVGTPFKELQQVLPGLNRNQIQDLMKELKKDGKVFCEGKTSAARWFAIN